MTTSIKAGYDANLNDVCSGIAYQYAKRTFLSRKNAKIGRPVNIEGGFTGVIDMGNFYLVQNEDGVGTKMMIAQQLNKFDTVGGDLVAMVADDAICVGAEVLSLTNTIDSSALSPKIVESLMSGLSKACREQKILIPGGEIAILKEMVNGYVWNATAVGVVEKEKFITGDSIRAGDSIVGLYSPNFRSNGFTLVRHILKKIGNKVWLKRVLEPSVIYHNAMLSMLGRFGEKRKVNIKGIAHITGGGIPGNAPRMFGKRKFGMYFHKLFDPPEMMLRLQKLGDVSDREVYETWNMGIGMVFVTDHPEKAIALLKRKKVQAQIVGEIVKKPGVTIVSQAHFKPKRTLHWVI